MSVKFIKSFFVGLFEVIEVSACALLYTVLKLIPIIFILFLLMLILTVTGLFDQFIDIISLDWIDIDGERDKMNMRGFGD